MRRGGGMTKTETVDVDVHVYFDIYDVLTFIDDYATTEDIKSIKERLNIDTSIPTGTLIGQMKNQLFLKAFDKYSLEELEERLGMDYM